MAWNDDDKNQNPWGNRNNQQGPPDLEKLIRDFFKKLSGSTTVSGSGLAPPISKKPSSTLFGIAAGVIFTLWVLAGFTIVNPAEQAAVLRFGQYKESLMPGPHWVPPLIDSVYKVNVDNTKTFTYKDQMLTKGENIVSVEVVVQYRIDNLKDYLFNAVNPEESLQQATASATRQEIGNSELDPILTDGRAIITQNIQTQLDKILNVYQMGVQVINVAMQPAQPPAEVSDAFSDVIKAREDQTTYLNQAQSYANKVVPLAQGTRARMLAEADAYQQQVYQNAQAAVAKFDALKSVYEDPALKEVTRERLYLDAMEEVYNKSSKVLVDVKNANNLLNLPLSALVANVKSSAMATSTSPVEGK